MRERVVLKTYRATRNLGQKYRDRIYREGTQRNLVVGALLNSGTSWTLDSLFRKLDNPVYWATVKHKDRNGRPSEDSWLMQEAGGIRLSIRYHLNALEKNGLIEVAQG
jgi:hypothetical protein